MDVAVGFDSVGGTNDTVIEQLDLYNYWAWSILDGALMLLIVSGNTLTILAVTLSRRLSSLVSNQFVLNLAVSDLMVGLTLPYHMVFYLDQEFGKIKWSCLMRFILIVLACLASIYNIIAIAVDSCELNGLGVCSGDDNGIFGYYRSDCRLTSAPCRLPDCVKYVAIVHPLHYSRYMTKVVTRVLMTATWSIALAVSMIPMFWNDWHDGVACEMNMVVPKAYTTSILAPMFSLIWMVMFILYWRIWREATCHARRMRANTCCPTGANDWKSIQVVLLVLGSFSLCWMPFVVIACAQTIPLMTLHNPIAYRLTSSLAMCNSGINPIIYAWKNAGFRAAFVKLLRCKRPDTSEYRGSPGPERKRGSLALREGSITRSTPSALSGFGGRPARVILTEKPIDTSSQCRIIENAGYMDIENGDTNPSYAPDGPTPVHRPQNRLPDLV